MLSKLGSFLWWCLAIGHVITGMMAVDSRAHAAAPDRRVALVIGNGAYQNVPPLANPLSDAKAVSAALKRLGFEVIEGYDLKIDGMRTLVGEFAGKLDGAKAALVFYAGHGIAVGDENFLLPTDAVLKSEADLDFRTVNVNLVLRQMQREERVNVLILDACRDNPFAKELARSVGKTRSTSISTGLTAIDTQASSGILIAFATDPRSVALDGASGRNSPFTSALLKHIETPGVSISTVMDRVREDVWTSTDKKQKPWVNTSIIGEFMLNPSAPAGGAVKQAALPPGGGSAPTGVGAGSGLDRAQMDVRMWETAEKSNTLEDYQAYLDSFPTGQFAAFAKNRIARLKSEAGGNQVASLPAEAELKEPGTLQTENAIRLTDNDRREVQNRLRATGFMVLPPTGKFGPATRESLSRWQAANNLPTTGYLTSAQKQVLWTKSEAAYRELLAAAPPVQAAPVTRNVRQSQPIQDDGAEVAQRRRAPQRQQAEQPQQQRAPTAGEIGSMMGGAGSLLQGIGALRR
jgi:uncharacterized caspase-like protein